VRFKAGVLLNKMHRHVSLVGSRLHSVLHLLQTPVTCPVA
jgi:hypothetical protein